MSEGGKRRDSRSGFEIEADTARRIAALKAAEDRVDSLLSEAQRQAEACRAHLLAHSDATAPTALIVEDVAEMREMCAITLRHARHGRR